MRQEIEVKVVQEVQSLAVNIGYKTVGDWFDGTLRALTLDAILPKHREGHALQPILIWLCGGGFSQVNEHIWLPEMVKYARAGITVISPRYRTSNEAPFPAQICDVKAAIRYVRANAARFSGDPDRIFLMGESAGAILSELAAATPNDPRFLEGEYPEVSDAVTGVIPFYGACDMTLQDRKMNWRNMAYFGGPFTEEQTKAASALTYLSKDAPPFLIFHGQEDEKVPVEQSEILYKRLTELGVPADYYCVKGLNHGNDGFYQDEIADIVIRFIKAH